MGTKHAIDFDNSYARLPERFFAKLSPKAVKEPKLIALNEGLSELLGLDAGYLSSPDGVAALSGNSTFPGSEPLAMAYAGQQFGNWVPQLGDGRALLLGEVIGRDGARYDIQLKGSGPTPFSRMGDGRAWLGPVLREYVVSEAMAALGVPTTRALAAVSTGEYVMREDALPGAVLTRVSNAHIRVGTFQYFIARGDVDALRELTDYSIARLYPYLKDESNPALGLLKSVVAAQAKLVAKWMNLGFIHGVMNTDNVSIAGETIDYGPCAFMDDFHPDRVFSSIDHQGRYAYSNQPRIAHWNMVQFAQCLLPLLDDDQEKAVALAQEAVNEFAALYEHEYRCGFNAKLGLADYVQGDEALHDRLLAMMLQAMPDFTNTFRSLALGETEAFRASFVDLETVDDWLGSLQMRQRKGGLSESDTRTLMMENSPAFIPRNHRIEQMIEAALKGDYSPFERLMAIFRSPFEQQSEAAELMEPPQPDEVVVHTFCGT